MKQPRLTRRRLLDSIGVGFGGLALRSLLADEARASAPHPLAARTGHHPPRARRVIFLFMHGGPSHIDLFDPKPRLQQNDGKKQR